MARRPASTHRMAPPSHYVLLTLGVAGFFIALRLLNLMGVSLFIDEALHIARAKTLTATSLNLRDFHGKWLSVRLISLFMQFPVHPLFAARLSSVIAGAAATALGMLLSKKLYSWREGLLSGLIFCVLPYVFFYNRLGLADTFQTLFVMVIALLSLRYAESKSWLHVVLIGIVFGLSVLIKFSSLPFVLLPFLFYVLVHPIRDALSGELKLAAILAPLFAFLYLYLRGGNSSIDALLTRRVISPTTPDILGHIWANAGRVLDYYWQMLTPPVAVIALASAARAVLKREPESLFLLSIILINVVPYILFGQTIYPRYLLVSAGVITLLVARGIALAAGYVSERWSKPESQIPAWKGAVTIAITIAALVWPTVKVVNLVRDPYSVALPPIVRWQYFTGWPSAYKIDELAAYLKDEARQAEDGIHVVRCLAWDDPFIDLYLEPSPELNLAPAISFPENVAEMRELAASRPTFFFYNPRPGNPCDVALLQEELSLSLAWNRVRPDSTAGLEVWRVSPADSN